jgi:uncharacterized protein DUF4154
VPTDPRTREPLPRRRPIGRPLAGVCALLILAAGGMDAPPRAEPPGHPVPEHQVKAAFLYHFTKYVEWPPQAFAAAQSSIVLGALGSDPFLGAVEEVIQGREVEGRALVWKRFDAPPRGGECHVLFVGSHDEARLKPALQKLKGEPILTVGDSEAFGRAGGIVWFRVRENRVSFVINTDAARRAGLQISSRLLAVATVVGDRDIRSDLP